MIRANVFDVAKFILETHGETTHMKLQKLVYYAQAWSLVWDESEIFPEPIQAWGNGPVVPELFAELKGKFKVDKNVLQKGDSNALTESQKNSIKLVLDFYGDKNPQWLSDLTHMEQPWIQARIGVPPGDRCSNVITLENMAEYYERLK
jgi:uncharacterized phage-associated protein